MIASTLLSYLNIITKDIVPETLISLNTYHPALIHSATYTYPCLVRHYLPLKEKPFLI